jgi:hypothetical protein
MCLSIIKEQCLADLHYAALSYVWGKASQTMLTDNNEAEICKVASMTEQNLPLLPKTIRDAIILCRSLNIRFIWINALCIRQGSAVEDQKDKKCLPVLEWVGLAARKL